MTLEAPMRCSALAEQLDEPMIGTVAPRTRWLLVEDRSAWGEKAVRDVLGAEFESAAKERRVRPLLVRRREGDPAGDAVRQVILVDTVTGAMAARAVRDVASLAIDEVAGAPIEAFGTAVPGPLFLVCTNGKRDACCALRGRALVAALTAERPAETWECTHLGGHRFAGNLVCLPEGIVYGRVTAADGPRIADAHADGRVVLDHLRGRSAWPAAAQVAELELRQRLGLDGIDDVALERADVAAGSAVVVLATADGRRHRIELEAAAAAPPRPTSCRGDELEEPVHWRVTDSSSGER